MSPMEAHSGLPTALARAEIGTGQVNGGPRRIPQNPTNKRTRLTQGADEGGRGM